jgi:uncharacterized protein (DUF302 family)
MKTIQLTLILLLSGFLTATAQNDESIYFSKTIRGDLVSVEKQLRAELKKEKFGVITEIDMSKTLKEKIDADIMPYKILGVCSPKHAYEALKAEENIGVFLPCKVILKQTDDQTVEIVTVNPARMMEIIGNETLDKTAGEVGAKLESIIQQVSMP